LVSEIALLQVELNAAKLEEFEAQEKLIEVTGKLETEVETRKRIEMEINELQKRQTNLEKMLYVESSEHNALKEKYEHEKKMMGEAKRDAEKVEI